MGGKNPGKPQKRSGGGAGGGGEDLVETEKPFHSKEFMQQELDNLLNAPERPTWDEFKEQQRKKGEMEGTMDKVEQEAQDRFRKELDADRAARLARKPVEEERGSKKKKKDKHKSKKDKARRPPFRPRVSSAAGTLVTAPAAPRLGRRRGRRRRRSRRRRRGIETRPTPTRRQRCRPTCRTCTAPSLGHSHSPPRPWQDVKRSKSKGMQPPVQLSSFFSAGDSD